MHTSLKTQITLQNLNRAISLGQKVLYLYPGMFPIGIYNSLAEHCSEKGDTWLAFDTGARIDFKKPSQMKEKSVIEYLPLDIQTQHEYVYKFEVWDEFKS